MSKHRVRVYLNDGTQPYRGYWNSSANDLVQNGLVAIDDTLDPTKVYAFPTSAVRVIEIDFYAEEES